MYSSSLALAAAIPGHLFAEGWMLWNDEYLRRGTKSFYSLVLWTKSDSTALENQKICSSLLRLCSSWWNSYKLPLFFAKTTLTIFVPITKEQLPNYPSISTLSTIAPSIKGAYQARYECSDFYPSKSSVSDATAALYSFLASACSLKWTSSHLYPFKCPPISHTCKDSWTKWQYATPFYPAHPWPSAITFFSSKSSTPHLYGGTPGQWWPTDTAPFKIFSFQELLHSSSITD